MNKELIDKPLRLDNDDGSYQQAVYSQPNYTDLLSASEALEKERVRKIFSIDYNPIKI